MIKHDINRAINSDYHDSDLMTIIASYWCHVGPPMPPTKLLWGWFAGPICGNYWDGLLGFATFK